MDSDAAPKPMGRGSGGSNLPPRRVSTDGSGSQSKLLPRGHLVLLCEVLEPWIRFADHPVSVAELAKSTGWMPEAEVASRVRSLRRIFAVDPADPDCVRKLADAALATGFM
jgi:hypothetical protein